MQRPRGRRLPVRNGDCTTERKGIQMDLLILIKNGCDHLTATVSPSVDSLGLHMVLSLATIMLAWFGVQEALASAHGGAGFNVARFLSFFMHITFAYCFVK